MNKNNIWEEDETWGEYLPRVAAQQGSRIIESILGTPGDVLKGVAHGAEFVNKGLTKGINLAGKHLVGARENLIKEPIESPKNAELLDYIPGSELVRKGTKKLTGGYTEPRTAGEESLGNITSSIASFFSPGFWSKGVPFLQQLKTAGKIVGSGQLAKGAASYAGLSEPYQEIANAGGMLFGPWLARRAISPFRGKELIQDSKKFENWLKKDIHTKGSAESSKIGPLLATSLSESVEGTKAIDNHIRTLYDNAIKSVPEEYRVSLQPVEPSLRKLDKILKHGFETPSKEALSKPVKGIQKILKDKNRTLSAFEATELKRNIDELIYESTIPDRTKKLLKPVAHDIQKDVLFKIAKDNPGFSQHFDADEIWKALKVGSTAQDFIKKNISVGKFVTPLTMAALGIGSHYGLGTLAKGSIAGFAAKELLVLGEQFLRSPALRKYYTDVMTSAVLKNGPRTARAITKFDDAIKKEKQKILGEGAWEED